MDNNINIEAEQTVAPENPKVRFAAGAIFLLMYTVTLVHMTFSGFLSVFNIMFTAAHLILAIISLIKTRGTALTVVLSILLFTSTLNASDASLLYIIQSFANITVWGTLLFSTLPESGAKSLSKYKIICSAIFYAAVIVETVTRFILYVLPVFSMEITDPFNMIYLSLYVLISSNVLFVLSTLLMAKWIFDPYERTHESVGPCNSAWVSERKSTPIGKHVALLLFTFGIWLWMWVYQTTKYTNSVKDEPLRSPRSQLLLYIFLPFYPIYWSYKTVKRMSKLQPELASDFRALCFLSSIFVPLLNVILIQYAINPQTEYDKTSLKSPYVELFAARAAAEALRIKEEELRAEKARQEAEELKAQAEAEALRAKEEAQKAKEEAEALNAVTVIPAEETVPEDTESVAEETTDDAVEEPTEETPTEETPAETAPDDSEETTEEPSVGTVEEETTENEPTETAPVETETVSEEASDESTDVTKTENTTI